MSPSDLFSQSASNYAQYRPLYPSEVYQWVYDHCKLFEHAWDCATGNGQVARELALRFQKIYATDLSPQQLHWAPKIENVQYLCETAESSSLADGCCDLITVAQAIHWFEFDKFYKQVYRILKRQGIFAAWVYENITINKEIDQIVNQFYMNILGPYWDSARMHIENKLLSIPFPFEEIICPEFEIMECWKRERFFGYLSSWSALRNYEKANGHSPIDEFKEKITEFWGDMDTYEIRFPVYMRMGKMA